MIEMQVLRDMSRKILCMCIHANVADKSRIKASILWHHAATISNHQAQMTTTVGLNNRIEAFFVAPASIFASET